MIRRLGLLLIAAFVLAACSKDEEEPVLHLSQPIALLAADADAVATIDVDAPEPWSLTTSGEGFLVSPVQGGQGVTRVTITVTEPNDAPKRRTLGSVRFRLIDGTVEYTLEVAQRPATATQTMLLYMPGHQLLDDYENNIDGIRSAVNARMPGDGRILVCYQPDRRSDRATLLEIGYDAQTQQCTTFIHGEFDPFRADDPADVEQMLAQVAEIAPAQRYGLVIGCHGKGWIPAGGSVTALGRRPGEADDLWTPVPGALPTRAFGDPGREMDIAQLAAAIDAQKFRIAWLIFDACFMANIETLYDLRGSVERVVAAPCEIMAAGFPYSRAVPRLFADNGATCDLKGACYEFWNFYENDWKSVPRNAQSGCISLAVTAELDGLADVMRRINQKGLLPYEPNDLQIYEGLTSHLFFDLGHYTQTVCPDAALLAEFNERMERAFPVDCRFHTQAFYSVYNGKMNPIRHYSGVSVSEPSKRQVDANRQTAWYRETH
ncbi:clostripain-related cysteine peptidase [Alistipes sp.]|uniref:clostripain-related cysteine peptidase n=1 Tax=Alistipes sp. TaxID=1872444 RepID=UPI003AF186E5